MMNRQVITVWRRLIFPHWGRTLALLLSVILGVAGLFSIEGVLYSAQESIRYKARDLLGADVIISSWRALDDPWSQATKTKFNDQGRTAEALELATMAKVDTQSQTVPRLVSLKGVSNQYPLHGELKIASIGEEGSLLPTHIETGAGLDEGGVWVAQSIWERLQTQQPLSNQYILSISGQSLAVLGVIKSEPDGGFAGALSFAPRVMMHKDTLHRLELIRFGSRVRRKLFFAFPTSVSEDEVHTFTEQLTHNVPDYIRVQNFITGQQNISTLLERVGLFFSMVALVALMLCLLAFTSGVWGLVNDLLPQIATARSLGVKASSIRSAFTVFIVFMTIMGSIFGGLIAAFVTSLLASPLSEIIGVEIRGTMSSAAALHGIFLALLMSLLVNFMVQRGLSRLDVQSLWGGRQEGLRINRSELCLMVIVVLVSVAYDLNVSSGSAWLGSIFAGLLLLVGLLSGLISYLWFSMLRILVTVTQAYRWPSGLLFAIKQMLGMRARVWVAIVSMGLSFSLMGGLELISANLINALKVDDETAPQVFLIDIQEDQKKLVDTAFKASDIAPPTLRPLIRARIASINSEVITQALADGDTPAARMRGRSLTREYNLTTQEHITETETVIDGQWWSKEEAHSASTSQVSVETRFAQRMDLKIGDQITFDIQGRNLIFTIANLRRVNWLSFAPNFIFVLPPGPLKGAPKTFISAARFPEQQSFDTLSRRLYKSASNISLIDLRPILKEARALLSLLNQALALTSMICAVAGILLMIHILRRDRQRRGQSVQLLSAIGVGKKRAWRWVTLELGLLGLGAGLTVLVGMCLCGWLGCFALKIPFELISNTLFFWVGGSITLPILISIWPTIKQSQ